jgi:tetratricopeptide (TPR) repeat protein
MRIHRHLYLLLPALAAFLVYFPGLSGPFLLDDISNQINAYSYDWDWEHILSTSFSNQSGLFRRPLANFTFVINALIDKSPWSYKLVNVILHLVTGALLFALLTRIVRFRYPASVTGNRLYLLASIALAIWLLHPLQVSTVLYAVQRMAVMSALFVMAALLSYVIFRERSLHNRPASALWYGFLYSVFGLLALGCKENAVLLPLFALAIELTIFQFDLPRERKARRSYLLFLLLLICAPLILGAVYGATHLDTLLAGYHGRHFSLTERLLTEAHALAFYLRLIFIPDLSSMSLFHDDFPVQRHLDLITLAYLALFFCAVTAAVVYRKRFPLVSLGVLWFFIAHLLESSFLPLELVFEHRNYLALAILPFICVEIAIRALSPDRKKHWQTAVFSGFALFLVLGTFLTFLRVDTWSSEDKLMLTLSRYHPDSIALLMKQLNLDVRNRRYDLAHERTDRIAQLRPREARGTILHLYINCREGIRSEDTYRKAVSVLENPDHVLRDGSGLAILGRLAIRGKCAPYSAEEILALLQTSLAENSLQKKPNTALTLHMIAGKLLLKAGDREKALQHYVNAHQSNPSDLGPLLEKGYLELNSGLLDEAVTTVRLLREMDRQTIRHYGHLIDELEQFITHARTEGR